MSVPKLNSYVRFRPSYPNESNEASAENNQKDTNQLQIAPKVNDYSNTAQNESKNEGPFSLKPSKELLLGREVEVDVIAIHSSNRAKGVIDKLPSAFDTDQEEEEYYVEDSGSVSSMKSKVKSPLVELVTSESHSLSEEERDHVPDKTFTQVLGNSLGLNQL